jgi:magnesium transporter
MTAPVAESNLSDPVSRHLRQELARLRVDATVGESLAALRQAPLPPRIVYFYVVDGEDHLLGVIPARALLLSPPETRVADIMLRRVVAVPADATVLEACEFFVLHRLLAFPVVDADRRLLGAIDVELYTDELCELGSAPADDLFQLIGVHLVEARQRTPLGAFRRRFPWLVCNIAGGIAAALLCGVFKSQLQRAVALALFIPVVLSLAESVSIQSVSLAVQSLHGRPLSWRQVFQRLRREVAVGVLLGGAAGLTVAAAALAWLGQGCLALAVMGGVAGGVAVAAALGMVVPHVLRHFRLDPRIAAGPIVLAATDVVTLLCYFSVARCLLR